MSHSVLAHPTSAEATIRTILRPQCHGGGTIDGTTRPADVTLDQELPTKNHFYRAVFLNDDYTHADFVEFVLMTIFGHEPDMAKQLTSLIHITGRGVAGIYKFDVAQAKAEETMDLACISEYPLRVVVEPASESIG